MEARATDPPWLQRALDSDWLLPAGLAAVGLTLVVRAVAGPWNDELFYGLMHDSGEFSVRLLVVSLAATPLQRIWPKAALVKWLRKRRRAFGVAAFGYALVHLAFHLVYRWDRIADDLQQWTYIAGFVAFALMVPLAATSFDRAVKSLGIRRWRSLHRLAYLVAVFAALHWLTKTEGDVLVPVVLHFVPLALLEANRVRLALRRRER
jgi:methionine sulfoxide reductase heme-binding subunit